MNRSVVITGMGAVTPLGLAPGEIISAIDAGLSACRIPTSFDTSPFDCKLAAEIAGFDAGDYFPDNKTLRMMNRDG
ncbi:MAG TPA: beta-ketoacyl-[acyl-carrier-protein] synthase II, partial [Phycisphaerae bacterium]|nr:beta-ketoacyl-[acyl-carrier-protein] synthase II [Phycisphaerae bacterium]